MASAQPNPRPLATHSNLSLANPLLRTRSHTQGAQIALVSPPPLGEVFEGEPFETNATAAEFAAVVRDVAEAAGERVSYVPFFETMKEEILERRSDKDPPPVAFDLLPKYGGTLQDPKRDFTKMILANTIRHYSKNVAWDAIGDDLGPTMFHDTVHLNERGAAILVNMLEGWQKEALPDLRALDETKTK